MKFLRQGICLAVLGAGLAAGPGFASTATAAPPAAADDSLVTKMKGSADGSVTVRKEKSTGEVGFIRTSKGGDLMPGNSGNASAKSKAYLDKYGDAFGADSGDLVQTETLTNRLGTTISFQQEYKDVPVFGTLIRSHVDKSGNLTAVNGAAVPNINVDTKAAISKSDAGKRALELVKAQPPTTDGKSDTSGIKAAKTDLIVYREGLAKGEAGGKNLLAYQVEVTNKANVRDMVFVNADTGKIVNRYSMAADALDRELYEADEDRNLTLVWQEGDALPGTLNEDQQNLVRSAGESYWFFNNVWGRDSYDGNGATMRTVNNDPAIRCPNANWNGTTTNYCDGVTSDDVVSHEWGHAYTEYTHGLIYQWQPGALNEAYSDVWGETVDLINDREDEGEGDLSKKRPVGLCSTHSPASPQLTINSPSTIAKDCMTGGASFGEQLSGTGQTGDVVIPTDAVETGGTATDGCSAYNEDVTGKIVMVDRGLCAFEDKAITATEEGAKALIIGNRDDSVIGMSGDNPDVVSTVSIGLTDRESIRTAIAGGETVNITMKDTAGDRFDSYRWLIGEKSPAFGGAIRDMWNPTCYGDPGKVSDAEYKCSSDDNGGVHGNSGVPNHGYALLVDGGTFNGVTVKGIGLNKAANIYYQAMTVYQTPVGDFVDHADSLDASCVDLTGKALNELSVAANDSRRAYDKITADDCAQVKLMAQAVELRMDPTEKCAWEPQLNKNTPDVCGDGFDTTEIWSDDFENGLDNWTTSGETVYGGYPTKADWHTTSTYRGDHTSSVIKGTAPDQGECANGSADISSANYLTSAVIEIPEDASAPRMQFDHYIATEEGYDGGNLQIKVNDGEFAPVAAEAFTFNAPRQLSTEAEQSTNPLAGQPGFTGTDPGSVFGSWGTSQVDLAAAGVSAGDEVELRFAIGRDGCGGVDGWYVDNVEVVACEALADITATHKPEPSQYGTASELEVTVDGAAGTPTGEVTVTDASGAEVGSTDLDDEGSATFALPSDLPVGANKLTVTYAGDDNYDEVTEQATATVEKATSVTKRTYLKSATVKRGGKFKAEFSVTAKGVTPTGTVTIYKGSTKIVSGALSNGEVKLSSGVGKLSIGKNKLTVKYSGSATVAASSTSFNLWVKR